MNDARALAQTIKPGALVVWAVYGRARQTIAFPWDVAQRAALTHGYNLFPISCPIPEAQ